ncbi:MAG: hypothetical protein WA150_11495 [Methylovirgula sp.]
MSSEDKAIRWRTGLVLLSPFLGIALLPMPTAEAQYAPWSYPYYDGYPPPMPPGRIAAGEMAPPPSIRADEAYGVMPLAEIRRRVAALGFHLIAVPRRKDRIYLAEAEDAHGLTHRLVFDAYRGNIVENTKLAVLPRKPKLAGDTGEAQAKPETPSKSVPDESIDKKPPLRTAQ